MPKSYDGFSSRCTARSLDYHVIYPQIPTNILPSALLHSSYIVILGLVGFKRAMNESLESFDAWTNMVGRCEGWSTIGAGRSLVIPAIFV